MLPRLSLRSKITSLILAMGCISIAGGSILYWYTLRMDQVLSVLIDKEMVLYTTAQDMQMALANQKGYLTYYFVDQDPEWLKELGSQRHVYKQKLELALSQAQSREQQELLKRIEQEYTRYVQAKDTVIQTYQTRSLDEITRLHRQQRQDFFNILKECEAYKQIQLQKIQAAQEASQNQARKLRLAAASAIAGFFLITLILLLVLFRQILEPIRVMAQSTGADHVLNHKDEIAGLSQSLEEFKAEYDSTHLELDKSREHLEQAGKMALVGKLAAGVAHNIRGPFTSIKMRLFSLSRNLKLSPVQEEDFEVISSEISRIDTIVQNFLEFSRPPKLRMCDCNPETIITSVLQLMQHRLQVSDVEAVYQPPEDFPEGRADPERLKEALINLVVNACEAMPNVGRTLLRQELDQKESRPWLVLKIEDTGPGISEDIRDRVLQPFFSTKEDGTGLGLSIVERIVTEHQGRLVVHSREGQGTCFEISLPWSTKH